MRSNKEPFAQCLLIRLTIYLAYPWYDDIILLALSKWMLANEGWGSNIRYIKWKYEWSIK